MIATTRIKWLGLALAGLPYPFLLLSAPQEAPQRVLYGRDVEPILKAHCVSCHGAKSPGGGLRLDTPAGAPKSVLKGDFTHSDLIRRIKGLDGKPAMPLGFPTLPKAKLEVLQNWIAQGARTEAPKALFARDIQPILKASCVSCHAGASAAGGLDLSEPKALMRSITKGNPEKSELYRRIMGLDGKQRMPKGFHPLTDPQIQAVRDWISEGAFLDGGEIRHWAYAAPVKPALPVVRQKTWVRNPIDAFILSRLEKGGLKPSAEADRATLIRRVSLDIIGLPPTPKEVDAFLADKRPDAYERVVDRLLASPHYGERMAQRWLDLARYADSDGYEKDRNRVAWMYRDWTINAFNRNLPFDEFTIEQIAGDQLPNAQVDQLVATGFSRNSMMNREDGTDPEEQHFNVLVDRVSTASTVFLGSTLGCARCHDHKYDPFSQKDFYRMTAFFSNDEAVKTGNDTFASVFLEEPEIKVPNAVQKLEMASLKAEAAKLPADAPLGAKPVWTLEKPTKVSGEVATLSVESDGTIVAGGKNPDRDRFYVTFVPSGSTVTGFRVDTITGRSDSRNFLLTTAKVFADGQEVKLAGATADFTQDQYNAAAVVVNDVESGWAAHPKGAEPHNLVLSLAEPVTAKQIEVVFEFQSRFSGHQFGRFRVSTTASPQPHAEHGVTFPEVRRRVFAAEQMKLDRNMASAPILREKPGKGIPHEWVRIRGEFTAKGEDLVAGPPTYLPPLKPGERPSRLALARWMVDPKNPLTARVEANRLWEGIFGTGLVETSEDFGTQGTPPTHPELLDWLAVRLHETKWNVKAMIRLMVTSAAYRQSSVTTPALLRRDPYNRLLARGPRYRLEAETIRDNALAIAGLLSPKIGGPSVMPDQPDGVWDNPYNGQNWVVAKGEDRFRRGMYTFWKRSAPFPNFTAFDATSRETCIVRRIRTNTPLQALALLNDSGMIAAAEALGKRMTKEGGRDPIGYGFRLATGRRASAVERSRLVTLRAKLIARYQAKPTEAAKLGGPEKAASTLLANVLLNLDETITKE
jgi:mono/diheme cytochrome c family protein